MNIISRQQFSNPNIHHISCDCDINILVHAWFNMSRELDIDSLQGRPIKRIQKQVSADLLIKQSFAVIKIPFFVKRVLEPTRV